MLQLERITKGSRPLKTLIGMGRGQFDDLLLTFSRVFERHALRQPRQRAIPEVRAAAAAHPQCGGVPPALSRG